MCSHPCSNRRHSGQPFPLRIDLKAPVKARYLRFVGKRVVEGSHVAVAELGVLGK